jgi:hypothetical protein
MVPGTRTSPLVDLVVAALQAASYDVPDGVGGTVTVARPVGLTVQDQSVDGADESLCPVIGVYPWREDAQHMAASGGVMDRVLQVGFDLAVREGGDSPHRALDPLRGWVIVATHHNPALQAALKEFPTESYTVWPAPNQEPRTRGPVHLCVTVLRLVHRTLYANPGIKR